MTNEILFIIGAFIIGYTLGYIINSITWQQDAKYETIHSSFGRDYVIADVTGLEVTKKKDGHPMVRRDFILRRIYKSIIYIITGRP